MRATTPVWAGVMRRLSWRFWDRRRNESGGPAAREGRALSVLAATLLLLLAALPAAWAQSSAYRGLWVGQATLNYVNEVTVPLDADNVPRAPDSNVPTPTADQAHLRLILHVNGAGQTTLVKDVAILNRTAGVATGNGAPVNAATNGAAVAWSTDWLTSESDLALVSDERLYPEFPAQPAVRYASAAFDFGDSRAAEAVNEVIAEAARAAGAAVFNSPANLGNQSARLALQAAAFQAATNAAGPVVGNADVAEAFAVFLGSSHFNSSVVNQLAASATAGDVTNAAQTALTEARNLQNRSFYSDGRAVEMIQAVMAATVAALAAGGDPTNAAQNAAAAYADVDAEYPRFLAGKLVGEMIVSASAAAASAATNAGATLAGIRAAANGNPVVNDARTEALRLQVAQYADRRAEAAIDLVLAAIANGAAAYLSDPNRLWREMATAAEAAGRMALAEEVTRYGVPADAPTLDYNEFVQSTGFRTSAAVAAQAAAAGAISEKRNNALYTLASIQGAAQAAAAAALRSVQSAAARAVRSELPLAGTFGPGQGDARLTWDIVSKSQPALSPEGALTGTIYLPANHPTNPFRHRRHPDHQVGFDVERRLRLDFYGSPTNALARSGYGVDRIGGVFREELFGLHKPLGPNPGTAPIGLKVEGTFELHRVSFIDALNAR